MKWLTDVSTVWDEIQCVLDENIRLMPASPQPDAVHGKYLTILSRRDLGYFGIDAKQVISPFHVIVESNGKIFKVHVVNNVKESDIMYKTLWQWGQRSHTPPRHFIIPTMTRIEDVFSYDKVPYGPLREEQAHKYLKTLSEKLCAALEELHRFGYAHSDIRLPYVCFNSNYDAVLIDMERCTRVEVRSPLSMELHTISCMYRKPKNMLESFTAQRMDYVQLGWLLVWVLNCTGEYHEREWEQQPLNIVNDVFLSPLVCQGVYSKEALESSLVMMKMLPFRPSSKTETYHTCYRRFLSHKMYDIIFTFV